MIRTRKVNRVQPEVAIRPVATAADRKAFVDLPFRLYAADPNWVPPLKAEVHGLIDPKKNPCMFSKTRPTPGSKDAMLKVLN